MGLISSYIVRAGCRQSGMGRIALAVSCALTIGSLSVFADHVDGYEATLDVVDSVLPGDTVAMELRIRPKSSDSVVRFSESNFSIHYDSMALSLVNLTIPDSLISCGWSPPRFIIAMPGTENCGSAQVQIILKADDTWFGTSCQTMTSAAIIFEFVASTDTSRYGDTALVGFCWRTCDDNSLSSSRSDTVLIVDEVFGWQGDTLTDSMSNLPGMRGLNRECRERLGLTGLPYLSVVDFHDGAAIFAEKKR